jgi:antitoxin component YwqK of YwqJK toxin-antitoxin module
MEIGKECRYTYRIFTSKQMAKFIDFYPKFVGRCENGYTGMCYTYSGNVITSEFMLINGKKNGECKTFSICGRISSIANYIDDKRISIEWYK